MTISITNIVSLVNGVLWNRFIVATFSNIPCIWYWARFILAICQRFDRGPFVQRYTDFSKLEMHDCKIAVVHKWCWSVLRYLGSWKYLMQNIDQTDADWRRTLFSSRDCWSMAVCRIGSGYHTLRKSYQTFENMHSLNGNGADLSPIWALLRRYLIKELTI